MRAVAVFGPGGGFGTMLSDFPQHCFTTDAIEGIGEVDLQSPLVLVGDVGVVVESIGGVDDGLRSPSHSNSELEGREIGGRFRRGFFGHTFGRPTADCFANSNWTMAARFLEGSEEVAPAEIGGDDGGRLASSQKIDGAGHRG